MKIFKTKEDGITLVALVVTIIILVILAAVAVSAITGKDGLFSQANNAGTLFNEKSQEEYDTLQGLLTLPYFSDEELENMNINETIEITNFSFEDNKLAENKNINIVANASGTIDGKNTPGITKVELKIGDELIYIDNVMATQNYNKTININNLNNLEKLNFYDDYTATLIVTTVGKTQESAACDNVKNYTIGSVDSLKAFANIVNSGINFANENIFQLTDINLNNINWTPIASTNDTPFSGIYNGNNKVVKGVNVSSSTYPVGFFGSLYGTQDVIAGIKNLTVEGTVKGGFNVGGIAGRVGYGFIDNCVNKATVTSTSYTTQDTNIGNCAATGGIVGRLSFTSLSKVQNCKNYGTVTASYNGVGGIAGWARTGEIISCENYADIDCNARRIGGIIGAGPTSLEEGFFNVEKCKNYGNITGTAAVGGIAGMIGMTDYSTISKCVNTKQITAKSYYDSTDSNKYAIAGGIAGQANGSVEYCYNTGNVNSSYRGIGGIMGRSNNTTISYCYNIGDLTNSNTSANGRTGGIVGRVHSPADLQIISCWKLENCIKQGNDNDLAGGDYKTADEIKSLSWNNFTVDSNLNNGFPVLTWETTVSNN